VTLTDNNGDEYDPVWSDTGDHIAYVANHTGNDEIWVMRADGGEQRQLTFNNWEWDKHPTWSPDGSQLAFFSNRSGQRQIWVMGSDGSSQRNLSNNVYDDWDPVWIK
jgi:Tol biopolymer transport system component